MLLGNKMEDMLHSKYLYTPIAGVEKNKSDMPHEDWIDLKAHVFDNGWIMLCSTMCRMKLVLNPCVRYNKLHDPFERRLAGNKTNNAFLT